MPRFLLERIEAGEQVFWVVPRIGASEAMDDEDQPTAGGASAADQLASLAELHDAGKLSDEEYAQAKAKVISS